MTSDDVLCVLGCQDTQNCIQLSFNFGQLCPVYHKKPHYCNFDKYIFVKLSNPEWILFGIL